MLAVGIWASLLGRQSIMRLPPAFLGAMLAGMVLALIGIDIPAVESGIVASVLVLGLAVATGLRLPAVMAAVICAIFGLVARPCPWQ
jgi:urease accessory protein